MSDEELDRLIAVSKARADAEAKLIPGRIRECMKWGQFYRANLKDLMPEDLHGALYPGFEHALVINPDIYKRMKTEPHWNNRVDWNSNQRQLIAGLFGTVYGIPIYAAPPDPSAPRISLYRRKVS